MSVVNHWGKWVSTEVPVTGVVSLNSLEHINDLIWSSDAINISQIDRLEEYKREKTREMESAYFDSLPDGALVEEQALTADEVEQWTQEFYDQDEEMGDSYLVGAWRKDENGLYEPDDLTDDNDFAAIVRTDSNVAQVVSSKWAINAELCSPCYPGQAHLDGDGDFMGYDFPDWVYGDRRQNRDATRFQRVDGEGNPWQVIAPHEVLYTVVVQVRKVVNGVVQEDYYNNIQDYYSGDEEGLFRGTCQAPRGDLQRINNIARGAWNIIDDQLRSIPA